MSLIPIVESNLAQTPWFVNYVIAKKNAPRGHETIAEANNRLFLTFKLPDGHMLANAAMSTLRARGDKAGADGTKAKWLCHRIADYVANPAPASKVRDYINGDIWVKMESEFNQAA